jgi:alpha-tubulin suppressor-like RCC1 family protein
MERIRNRRDACISCGPHHTAVITPEGTVACWGRNDDGQCVVPIEVNVKRNVVAVSCGTIHMAALTEDGTVVCWGYNDRGQCDVPLGLQNVVDISCGDSFTIARTAFGTLVCRGQNYCGQCEPPPSTEDAVVVAVSAGADHCGAVLADGSVLCWGSNDCAYWIRQCCCRELADHVLWPLLEWEQSFCGERGPSNIDLVLLQSLRIWWLERLLVEGDMQQL